MAMRSIDSFFKKATCKEDTIPKEWQLPHPPPKVPEKNPVGRPKKRKEPDDVVEDRAAAKEDQPAPPENIGSKRRKYQSYSDVERRKILNLAEQYGVRAIAQRFKITASTISTWKKTLRDDTFRKKGQRMPGGGRNLSYSIDTDDKIVSWILQQRDLQLPVTCQLVQNYAMSLVKPECPEFKASYGWLRQFFIRHHLTLRAHTSLSQKLPADLEVRLHAFYTHLKEIRLDCEFEEEFIINMDEVPMFFEIVPSRSVSKIGEKDVRVITTGCEKRHLTLVSSVTASGRTLPPMIIFKGKREPSVNVPAGWVVIANEKAWMNSSVMVEWLKRVLRSYTERRPSLLVLDSFSGHTTEEVKAEMKKSNTTPAFIPGGCTSKAQPLDVSINKPFKDAFRRTWVQHMQDEMSRCVKDGQLIDSIRKPDKQLVCDWIVSSWGEISNKPEMVKKSFRVTGIANALNGSEDAMIRDEGLIEDIFDSDEESDVFEGFLPEDVSESDDPFSDLWK